MKTLAFLLVSTVVGIAVTGFNNPSFRSQVNQRLLGNSTARPAPDAKFGVQVQNNLHVQPQAQVGASQKKGDTLHAGADAQSKGQVKLNTDLSAPGNTADAAGKLNAATQMKVDVSQSSKVGEQKAQDSITLDAAAKAAEKIKTQVDRALASGTSAALNADTNITVSGGLNLNR